MKLYPSVWLQMNELNNPTSFQTILQISEKRFEFKALNVSSENSTLLHRRLSYTVPYMNEVLWPVVVKVAV